MFYYLFIWIAIPIFWIMYRPRILWHKRVLRRGKVVYISNHYAFGDPVALACTIPRFLHFMAKADLFRKPLGRFVFRMMLTFPVEKKSADITSIKTAVRLLKRKCAFAMYPEGARSKTEEILPLNKGVAMIARLANAPIIPIYIHPSIWRKWKMNAAVGEAIELEAAIAARPDMKPDEAITAAVSDALHELRGFVIADMEKRKAGRGRWKISLSGEQGNA